MRLPAHIPLITFYVPKFMGHSHTLSAFLSPGVILISKGGKETEVSGFVKVRDVS